MSEPSDPHKSVAPWRNWAGDERCAPVACGRPAAIEELSEVPTYRGEGQCFL